MKKIFKYLALIILLVLAVFAAYYFLKNRNSEEKITVSRGEIHDIKPLVQLCTVEVYSEVPVLDTINNKVIFAIQKQTGRISFDVESLQYDARGDTVSVTLPPEIVEVTEAVADNSWQVIDTKNIGFLGVLRSDKLTLDEENKVKEKVKSASVKRLYDKGVVKRAREEGASNLQSLLQALFRKPVIINDPTPNGTPKP